MIKVRFYLSNPKGKTSAIRAAVSIPYLGRKRYNLGISIDPKKWDFKKQLPKPSYETQLIKDKLIEIERKITKELHAGNWSTYHPSKRAHAQDVRTFEDYAKLHIKQASTRDSQKGRRSRVAILKRFDQSLDWNSIDLVWHSQFLEWCDKQQYSKNYQWTILKTLKTILNMGLVDGAHSNTKFQSAKFYKPKEAVEKCYLTEDEIDMIEAVQVEGYLLNTKKLFLIEYHTGMRFSELVRIGLSSLVNNVLTFKQPKSGKVVSIPLKAKAVEILERGNFRTISNQKYNAYIKELVKAAGIDSHFLSQKTGERVDKASKCTSHTARRSFATNAWLNGVPLEHIQYLMGHSSIDTTRGYILATNEERARVIGEHPFLR